MDVLTLIGQLLVGLGSGLYIGFFLKTTQPLREYEDMFARTLRAEAKAVDLSSVIIEQNATMFALNDDLINMTEFAQKTLEQANSLQIENTALHLQLTRQKDTTKLS